MNTERNSYQVRCQDGIIRHDQPFATRREAERFAHFGHCCLNEHAIEIVRPANSQAAVQHAQYLAIMGETQLQAWARDRSIDLSTVMDAFLDAVES